MRQTYFWNSSLKTPETAQTLAKLDRGIAEYTVDSSRKDLQEYISQSYTPLSYIISKRTSSENLETLLPILKVVISVIYSTAVSKMVVNQLSAGYQIVPYTDNGNRVWIAPNNLVTLPVSKWLGKELISTSSLARYFLEKYVSAGIYPELPVTYYFLKDGYLTLLPNNDPLTAQVTIQLDQDLQNAVSSGYFSYTFSAHDYLDRQLVREICQLWDIQIIDETDPTVWILQTGVSFSRPAADWLRDAITRVGQGEFPVYSFKVPIGFTEEYNRHWGWDYIDVILKYAAYLSLSQLAVTDPLVQWRAGEIVINPDLSINLALPSYSLMQKFKTYFQDTLDRGIRIAKGKPSAWNIQPCQNLTEGIVKRWAVQESDSEAYPMVLTNLRNDNILIDRSQKTVEYTPETLSLPSEKVKDSLLEALKEHYQICHDDIEAVTLERISEMSLEQLLEIVPVQESGKTYCFLAETISQLERLENPLTRTPLSERVLEMYQNLENGLRGLFDVGPIWGILSEPKLKVPEILASTQIKTKRISIPENRRELLGNVFSIEIIFANGDRSDLFKISLPLIELQRVQDLRKAVETLWFSGFFLNPWNRAVATYTSLDSFEISALDPVLVTAADSIYDGDKALQYLQTNSQIVADNT